MSRDNRTPKFDASPPTGDDYMLAHALVTRLEAMDRKVWVCFRKRVAGEQKGTFTFKPVWALLDVKLREQLATAADPSSDKRVSGVKLRWRMQLAQEILAGRKPPRFKLGALKEKPKKKPKA